MVVALIVFGPRKLPEMGKSLGKMMAEFRKASSEFQRTIEDEVEADRVKNVTPAALPPAGPADAAATTPAPGAPENTVERDPTTPSPIEPK